jgi:hypothetical protein
MHYKPSHFWALLWLCAIPTLVRAEFVSQVDSIAMFYAILFLGLPLAFLLLYLLVRSLKRKNAE